MLSTIKITLTHQSQPYTLTATTNSNALGDWNTNLTLPVGGIYNLVVRATDRVGNIGPAAASVVIIDSELPTVTVSVSAISPVAYQAVWLGSDTESGIHSYEVEYRDALTPTWNSWLQSTTDEKTTLGGQLNHDYYVRVRARDKAGNVSAWVEAGSVALSVGEVKKYYSFGGQRVAMRDGDEVYYLSGDHLGSVSLTTDANGAVVSEVRYRLYGEGRWSNGVSVTDFGFTSQRHDSYKKPNL